MVLSNREVVLQPTSEQVAAVIKGDAGIASQLRSIDLKNIQAPSAENYWRMFNIRYEPNYMPSELIGPLKKHWEAENLRDLVVVDVGSGCGGTVLMLSKEKRLKLAIGIDMNPDAIRFSRFLASKYANHPEVLQLLSSWDGVTELTAKYNAIALNVTWKHGEPFILSSGAFAYPDYPSSPYLPSKVINVPLMGLIEVLEWKSQRRSHPPTPKERAKMLFIQTDGKTYNVPDNTADAVICIDSAHWQTIDPLSDKRIRLSRDPMMEAVLRMAKPGALLHVHSREYTIDGIKGLAQTHLKRLAIKEGVVLEDLGPTFLEAPAGMCRRDAKNYAHLYKVKEKQR